MKGPPWIPSRGDFDQYTSLVAKDFELMRSAGINLIRLGVMWPGVEPVRIADSDQPLHCQLA